MIVRIKFCFFLLVAAIFDLVVNRDVDLTARSVKDAWRERREIYEEI